MTPETLKMYKKLQPLFREKMGPEQVGDRIYDTRDNMTGFVSAIDGIRLDYITDEGNAYWSMVWDTIRLPLPIDPVNPERGLWGMVDWSIHYISHSQAGKLSICNTLHFVSGTGTPTEALLRALLAQEGL